MSTLRTLWNCGGNWFLFMGVAFGAVELGAMWLTRRTGEHWRTLSGTFWAAYDAHPNLMTLILFAGVVVLVAHFVARLWRG